MIRRATLVRCLAVLGVVLAGGSLLPDQTVTAQEVARAGAPATAPPLSPAARSALINQLVDRWGASVQAEHGLDVDVWRSRLLTSLMRIDGDNLRDAVTRETYEEMMATLVGRGDRTGERLGDLTGDLTYTPLQPCRILDTRATPAGPIPAGSTRPFVALALNFAFQGGSSNDCGTAGIIPTAVAINLTAVDPAGPGYATVFPFQSSQPLTASVNFAAGAIINNTLIAKVPNPLLTFDFTVYSFAQAHYVGDLVGFFAPNQATALQCIDTAPTSTTIFPSSEGTAVAPACPIGYTATGTNCEAVSIPFSGGMPLIFTRNGTCKARNDSGSTQTLTASQTCCRVPGR